MSRALNLDLLETLQADDDPARPEWQRLYSTALSSRLVSLNDCLTIRDLLELAGDTGEDACLHALLLAMFAVLGEGSVCLRVQRERLMRQLCRLTNEGEQPDQAPRAARLCEAILKRFTVSPAMGRVSPPDEAWPELIGREGQFKPMVRAGRGGVPYLYFQRYYEYTSRLRLALRARLDAGVAAAPSPGAEAPPSPHGGEGKVQPTAFSAVNDSAGFQLSGEQERAVRAALTENFVIVSGGPGTGKTSIVVSILRELARMGFAMERILLAAPTGRAAYRMTESIRRGLAGAVLLETDRIPALEARTLHRLLQYRPWAHDFTYGAQTPLPADVLIIDELSMVDVTMMTRVLEALPESAKLILLGDRDQLPSVDAGAVLADLVPPGSEAVAGPTGRDAGPTVVFLQESHRTEKSILEVAAEVKAGIAKLVVKPESSLAARFERDPASGHWQARVPWPVAQASGLRRNPEDCATGYRWIEMADAPDPNSANAASSSVTPGAAILAVAESWARHHYLQPVGREALSAGAASIRTAGVPPVVCAEDRRDAGGTIFQQPACATEASYRELIKHGEEILDFATVAQSSGLRGQPEAGAAAAEAGPESQAVPALLRRIFSALQRSQILTVIREGSFGCAGINRRLMQAIRRHFDAQTSADFFAGLPILVTRNEYDLDLFNGDVGVVLKDRNRNYRAVFSRPRPAPAGRDTGPTEPPAGAGEFQFFALDALHDDWEPAFALTVHKSQGSEYEQVLLVLPPLPQPDGGQAHSARHFLTREILYTGLTRAKHLAVLCGSRGAIEAAVANRIERDTGISLYE